MTFKNQLKDRFFLMANSGYTNLFTLTIKNVLTNRGSIGIFLQDVIESVV